MIFLNRWSGFWRLKRWEEGETDQNGCSLGFSTYLKELGEKRWLRVLGDPTTGSRKFVNLKRKFHDYTRIIIWIESWQMFMFYEILCISYTVARARFRLDWAASTKDQLEIQSGYHIRTWVLHESGLVHQHWVGSVGDGLDPTQSCSPTLNLLSFVLVFLLSFMYLLPWTYFSKKKKVCYS